MTCQGYQDRDHAAGHPIYPSMVALGARFIFMTGMKAGDLTFADGQRIFHEQAPMGEQSYRTICWGRDLQIWFTDGPDNRSPNKMEDWPEKTIWSAEQKAWFKRTVKESDATWKVLISQPPLVAPDRGNKNDNQSNEGFMHESDELRAWLKANVPDNWAASSPSS